MGRPRGFDEGSVVAAATDLFGAKGFDAVSVDVLVAELGISRASLYKLYGSKHGLLAACLNAVLAEGRSDDRARDLVLVTLVEAAPHDPAFRRLARRAARTCFGPDIPATLGARLLSRAGIHPIEEDR